MKYRLNISLTAVVDVPDGTDLATLHELYDEDMSVEVRSSKPEMKVEDHYCDNMEAMEVRDSGKT